MRHDLNNSISALCRLALASAAFALAAATPASATNTLDPHGVWLRPEGGVQFGFYDCGALLCAKVVAAQKSEDQASIGTVILKGAVKTGANEWKGKLYNSEDGKVYDGVITVKSASQLTLEGCVMGVLCGGETWTRVSAAPPSSNHAALATGAK
jgi:uncharacterized protein (DUF2147 family)